MAHVVATAFASKVFPVPGGPYSSRPERHRPSESSSGCSRGNWIVSRISFFTSWSPPTSCQDTEGIYQERESPCQHLFLSPKQAWPALAPVMISPLCHQLCLAMEEISPAIPAMGSPSIYIFPLLSFAMGKTNCTCPQASCAHSMPPHLQSSIAWYITCQQKYPGERICQGCLQLCGETALLQKVLGKHKVR